MDEGRRIWRYMSFSRFVWLMQKRRLWLARVDTFPDPWEVALTHSQLEYLEARAPLPEIGAKRDDLRARAKLVQALWRAETFVNCWTASNHESHALWRIFCGPTEGVAIQTTLGQLQTAMEDIRICEVVYGEPANTITPQQIAQATVKRLAFEYEHEVRIIATADSANPKLVPGEFGLEFPIDLSIFGQIVVHPEADESFKNIVAQTVGDYEPSLRDRVHWSAMREKPPF